ncbi:16S rRNA (uracil(1498)-N(3))-methyltransferase [Bordetella genomosp. 9]|uniref:Ribosomal RNA small subunit methyltransferase E n=1 Tax=Bordetella genomosp. 9 TaxID=1416803 RepID=A0A261RQF3_9BORD|nr:16S rRNA (uracil(1498)-N(3))-methyltransferase [Bordetella genomosp. 9]OZI26523.1 16S rRNA (uracil(1498)-N(3))-methyltransferase [Bordetella genomosp. 9]
MPSPRFYCSFALAPHARIELPDAIAHHAARVLRLRDGDTAVLFDGTGGEYPATLAINGKSVHAELGAHDTREAELAGTITLVQGLPSGDKMDWIVEKAVELGVQRLVPVAAQRSVLQLNGERQDKRLAHWRRIATAASEQCGRNRLMRIEPVTPLARWLETAAAGPRLLCHPDNGSPLKTALRDIGDARSIALLVGPEGGWSDAERDAARAAGVDVVSFGPRVLRTETAGLALAAAATALLDWDGPGLQSASP